MINLTARSSHLLKTFALRNSNVLYGRRRFSAQPKTPIAKIMDQFFIKLEKELSHKPTEGEQIALEIRSLKKRITVLVVTGAVVKSAYYCPGLYFFGFQCLLHTLSLPGRYARKIFSTDSTT